MAITALTATPLGGDAYLLAFASDLVNPTFYVYLDGLLVGTTQAGEFVVRVPAGASPVFEVLDTDATPPQDGHPATVQLAWYAPADGAAGYRVQRLVAAVWITLAVVTDTDAGYFRWESEALADVTTHQFRIVPVGDNGNTGTAVTFAVLMARRPDPPAVDFAYDDGTGAVTISAA